VRPALAISGHSSGRCGASALPLTLGIRVSRCQRLIHGLARISSERLALIDDGSVVDCQLLEAPAGHIVDIRAN